MEIRMKRIIALILLAALAFSVSLSFVGCGAPEDPGAEIGVYLGDRAFDFDPSDYYVDSNAEQVMSLLFEPLFTVDEDGDLECAAADDYDINEKEREIVITLRETYWSDDVQVKAQDYIYAWRDVILEPNNPNHAAALFYDIENAIEVKNGRASLYEFGAVASDVFEITIKYREGADTEQLLKNLASVATSPLREDVVSKAKTYWSKSIVTIVTNGPFKVKIFDEALGEFELERNLGFHQNSKIEDYDDEVIPYKLISTFRVDDTFVDLTYSDIENKTVFYLGDAPLSDRAANKDKAVTFDDLSTYSYVFNTEKPLFAIKEVR
jgi:ABC-type oligopeptide transport system substrate-binding subunit